MGHSSIVVVGSSNTDLIIRLKRLPRPGETVVGGAFFTAAGGKGANQAVAAARAGGKVTFVGCLGRDRLGDEALAGFVREGVDAKYVSRSSRSASGTALIFVAQSGENSIAVAGGANDDLSPLHIRKARTVIARAKGLLIQLEIPLPTVEAAVHIAAANGVRVILNPAPARPLPDRLLRSISILTPNQSEVEALTGITIKGITQAERAAEKLRRRGVETVIITMGAQGALISSPEGTELVRGFKVRAVDTTAAGDVFSGTLALALTQGQRMHEAVRFANAAAALSVKCVGAQTSAPTRIAIEKLLISKLNSGRQKRREA